MSIQNHVAVAVRRLAIAAAAVLVAGLLPSSMSNAQMALPLASVPSRPSGQTRHRNISVARQGSVLDVEITFSPQDVSMSTANGFTAVDLSGCRRVEPTPGHPLLPAQPLNVLIPSRARVESVEVEPTEILLARDVLMYPAQPAVPVSTPLLELPAFVPPDPATYAIATKMPAVVAELTGQHRMRGHVFVSLRINPVRYVPATRELYLATRIQVRLHCAATPWPDTVAGRDHHGVFRAAVADTVMNGQMLEAEPAAVSEDGETVQPTGLTDYLVITSDALASTFQALADHRAVRNGFSTAVVSVETIAASYTGIDLQTKIRACITDYVRNRGTVYVVLGGDDTVVKERRCTVSVGATTTTPPTDLYYAGLDGTWDDNGNHIYGEAGIGLWGSGNEGDLAPDVYVGRIPVRTAQQADAYINKVIQFEENPIPQGRMLLAGSHLGGTSYSRYTGTNRPTDAVTDGYSDFASHSPISDTEMWTRRLYRDSVQKYWQPDVLGLFFDTITMWDTSGAGSYESNSAHLRTVLNQEWYQVFILAHGTIQWWALEADNFTTSTAAAVTGRLGFIYTGSCMTAAFESSTDPCLSEAFLRNANGPVAYFGCSRDNWYTPNPPPALNYSTGGAAMDWARDFYEQFYGSPHASLAQVFYAHKAVHAEESTVNYIGRWLMFGINYQGDPALLAPAVPQVPHTLTVNVQGVATVVLDPPGGTYDHGTSVQVTIVPDLSWKFVRWEGAISGAANPAIVMMNSDKTITAILAVKGDVNGDGYVNVGDLQLLVASWGRTNGEYGYDARADCDGNNTVNVGDLQVLVASWGYAIN